LQLKSLEIRISNVNLTTESEEIRQVNSTEILLDTATIREVNSTETDLGLTAITAISYKQPRKPSQLQNTAQLNLLVVIFLAILK